MPQFCILFYANYTVLATQRGGHGLMAPPKYVPGSRPRTQKISRPRLRTDSFETKAKDQGHRRKCSKKKGLQKFFSGDLKKKVFKKVFQAKKVCKKIFLGDLYLRKPKKRSLQIFRKISGVFQRNFNGLKILLSSSRGQGNFRGLEASRPRPRTSKCVLEAKDVLEDSTSDTYKTDKHHNSIHSYI